jgi:hypothetical protein
MDRVQRAFYRAHVACYATLNTGAISIWAWTGGHEFWPALTLVPGGALLLWHRKGSRAASRRLEPAANERSGLRSRRALSL